MVKYEVLVRVDASDLMGTGHVMRCIAFAQYCRAVQLKVLFVLNQATPMVVLKLQQSGFDHFLIKANHLSSEEVSKINDLIKKYSISVIIFDGYQFTHQYLENFKSIDIFTVMIDDYQLAPEWINMVINQNPWASDFQYKNQYCYLGLEYLLLRHEFRELSNKLGKNIVQSTPTILLTLGGTDPNQMMEKILAAFDLYQQRILIRVLLGNYSANATHLQAQVKNSSHQFEWIDSQQSAAQAMFDVEVAVSSAGSTCWELAFLGKPVLALIQADNQAQVAQYIENFQIGMNGGWHNDWQPLKFVEQLSEMLSKSATFQANTKHLNIAKRTHEIAQTIKREH